MATPDRLRIAQDFGRWARSQLGARLIRVVLFGSVARREDRKGSDIDVLVEVTGDAVSVRRLLGGRIMEVAAEEGVFISAFVQSQAEAATRARLGIDRAIDEEGRVLA